MMPHKETINKVEGIWIQGAWFCCDWHRYSLGYVPTGQRGLCCPFHHMQFGTRNPDGTVDFNICNQNLFLHKETNEPVYKLTPVKDVKDEFGESYYMIPDWCPCNKENYLDILSKHRDWK